MITLSTLLKYYKRPEIQQAIMQSVEGKEIAVRFGEGFGKRPDTLQYPSDVLEFAKQGATSFHCSEELWSNPLQLSSTMSRQEQDKLRTGWDLLLDIDCPVLEYSTIGAHLIVEFLKHLGIKNVSVKFSGNHGFHIGIPFEAFPDTVLYKSVKTPTKLLFPEGPRAIAAYISERIRDVLRKELLRGRNAADIARSVKKEQKDVFTAGQFDPFKVLSIDTVLIASRHLYRMPYALNEKSGLASIVIMPDDILGFDKKKAEPSRVTVTYPFLDRKKAFSGEARKLLEDSFAHQIKRIVDVVPEEKKRGREDMPTEAIVETAFPPCMKLLLTGGMKDGKKRALFALTNFFSSVGWNPDQIDARLKEWNKTHPEPLRDVILLGHLRYHKQRQKTILPPNCKQFYQDLGVCHPDGLCMHIKNPANYAILRARSMHLDAMDEEEHKNRRRGRAAKEGKGVQKGSVELENVEVVERNTD